jgi:glycosyltransferase involved in cell wall biosynthesis
MDNSPNCLAEAMAVGTPSLATKVGGIPSMIRHGVDGMLFKKHDSDELVRMILLLANDVELQNTLSVNARARAYERNYPPNVAERYVRVYKSMIK